MMKHWVTIARELPLNGKTQTECPEGCGGGDKLSVNHNHKSYWCYCYRCGHTDQEDKGVQTLADLKEIQKLNDEAATIQLGLELPHDFTTDIPLHGRLWLYKGGITPTEWAKYRIGYSKSLDRVILPIYNNTGDLIWYQCRALLKGQKPKYIQPARDRSEVVFHSARGKNDYSELVLTEDILSAIRVGRHVPACSLLGTKVTTQQAASLGKYSKVIVWLDPDKAGRSGSYSIRKTLGLITEVKNVVTDKDPKELSDKEIKEALCVNTMQ